jgi:hypothetical protein
VGYNSVEKPNLKIARINVSKVRGPVSAFEYHYLIGTPSNVQYVIDRGSLGLWTHQEHLDAFRDAGLEVSFDNEGLMGRGLYLGVKP